MKTFRHMPMPMKTWEDVWPLMQMRDGHYSLTEDKHRVLFVFASALPPDSRVLELGVCHGRTAVMFAALGHDYYGIDDFGLEGSAKSIRDFLQDNNLPGLIFASNTHTLYWNLEVDFLLIDAGHDESNVKPDIEKYLPFLRPGGIVAFDDYDHPYERNSPHWAVRYYADLATDGWERLHVGNGMAIMKKPEVGNNAER